MRPELRERRERTWRMLVEGHRHSDVCQQIADEYDVTESTVATDISRMDQWLPKLGTTALSTGLSRIRELRQNRAEYYQMATTARESDNPELELRIRRRIDQNLEQDIDMTQALGLTRQEPSESVVTLGGHLDPEVEAAYDALTTDTTSDSLDVE